MFLRNESVILNSQKILEGSIVEYRTPLFCQNTSSESIKLSSVRNLVVLHPRATIYVCSVWLTRQMITIVKTTV